LALVFVAASSSAQASEWRNVEDEDYLNGLFVDHSELVDPFSVQFRNLRMRQKEGVSGDIITVWCGQSNQKNKMGAYGGWARFYAVEGLQEEPAVGVAIGDRAEMTMVMIEAFCEDDSSDDAER
jgi:hypothetical protein